MYNKKEVFMVPVVVYVPVTINIETKENMYDLASKIACNFVDFSVNKSHYNKYKINVNEKIGACRILPYDTKDGFVLEDNYGYDVSHKFEIDDLETALKVSPLNDDGVRCHLNILEIIES